jgi:hypothetical protein
MRHDVLRALSEQELKEHIIYFQIANARGRRACSVRLQAANKDDANRYFRNHWPEIEVMARNCLVEGLSGDGEIRILVPPIAYHPSTFNNFKASSEAQQA